MPFTAEQDAFILKAHYRSGVRRENGERSYSLQSCIEQFREEYPDYVFNYKIFAQHRDRIIDRFQNKNCICKGKTSGRPSVLTEEVVDDVRRRIEMSPTKSIRKLSAQSGLSYGTARKALIKNLHMHPYKVTVIHQLLEVDYERRVQYCHWFNGNLNDDILNITFMSDEAWFHLSGYIHSQNYRTWATENPHNFVETSLHPLKIGVWVAMSRRRIIGPIFFNDTLNAERYRTQILDIFLNQLHDDELQEGYFQQDGAPPHVAHDTIAYLQQFFDNRLISRDRWPSRSPDLTPLDFHLFGYLKSKVFRNRQHNLEELQAAIVEEINNIDQEKLQRIFANMRRRVNLCLDANGRHFEHLL